jgi:hypothetical protein
VLNFACSFLRPALDKLIAAVNDPLNTDTTEAWLAKKIYGESMMTSRNPLRDNEQREQPKVQVQVDNVTNVMNYTSVLRTIKGEL